MEIRRPLKDVQERDPLVGIGQAKEERAAFRARIPERRGIGGRISCRRYPLNTGSPSHEPNVVESGVYELPLEPETWTSKKAVVGIGPEFMTIQ